MTVNGSWDLPARVKCQAADSCVCLNLEAEGEGSKEKVGTRSLKEFTDWALEGSSTPSKYLWAIAGSLWPLAVGHDGWPSRVASAISAGPSRSNTSTASLNVPQRHPALVPGQVPARGYVNCTWCVCVGPSLKPSPASYCLPSLRALGAVLLV